MKRNAVLVVAMLAMLPSGAIAAKHKPRPCEIMTDAQVDADATAMFPKLDYNHDGHLARSEIVGAGSARRGAVILNVRRWKESDVDKDGKLSMDELKGTIRRVNKLMCERSAKK